MEIKKESKFVKRVKEIIPGIIIAAIIFGPSKMTITSKLGTDYGYSMLWIVVVAIFFMTVFTKMASRIGAVKKDSLLTIIGQKWGKWAAVVIGVGIFLVAASFQAGNSIGVGISIGEATETSPKIWVIVFNIIGILLLFFRGFYKILEKLMLLLIFMMLLSFVITAFVVDPKAEDIIQGFVPSLPEGSVGLVIAFMASCFSIVGAFYQAYVVQERKKSGKEDEVVIDKSTVGMIVLGLMSAIVMICAATVLHPKGIKLTSAMDMAKALEPLFGHYASMLFLIGLFGASFSSVVGNASIGGTMLGDALGYGGKLQSAKVRVLIAILMIIGATVAIIFGKLPLELIVLAQSVTIFLVPFIGIAMFLVANDEKIMGQYKNSRFTNIFGVLGLLLLAFLAISNIYDLFIK